MGAIAAAGAALVLLSLAATTAADAQITCGQYTYQVTTEAEMNAAIGCFNSGSAGLGTYRITIDGDINVPGRVSPAAALTVISQPVSGYSLIIDATAGSRLRTDTLNFPNTRALLATSQTNRAEVTISATIEADTAENALIEHYGESLLIIRDASLSIDFGVVVVRSFGPPMTIQNAHIAAGLTGTGVMAANGPLDVYATTFSGPDLLLGSIGILYEGPGSATIETSTFNTGYGVLVDHGPGDTLTVAIHNATFAQDSVVDATNGQNDFDLDMRSNLIYGPCNGFAIDEFDNVSSCFPEPLADNGCSIPTSIGCVPTIALSTVSDAIGAGDCANSSLDQRGQSRQAGPGCDAGAFESPEDPDCDNYRRNNERTEAEVSEAIFCFNAGIGGPGVHQILVTRDIEVTTSVGDDSALTTIDQTSPGYELRIEGTEGARLWAQTADPEDPDGLDGTSLLAMGPTNVAPVTVSTTLETQETAFFAMVLHQGPGPLTFRNASLKSSQDAPLVRTFDGLLTVDNSIIAQGMSETAILVEDEPLIVRNSTFTGDGDERGFIAIANSFDGGGSIIIENSTFNTEIGVVLTHQAAPVLLSIHNSTFADSRSLIDGNGDPAAISQDIRSNLSLSNCGQEFIDQFDNVYTCIDFEDPNRSLLADNGCTVPTSTGCVPTIDLDPDWLAIGAGDCTGLPVDQRGQSRVLSGFGCDAGAVESPLGPTGCQLVNGRYDVASHSDLNFAISCFNRLNVDVGVRTIRLLTDIASRANYVTADFATGELTGTSAFRPISPSANPPELIIEGRGVSLSASTTGPDTQAPLLAIVGDRDSAVTIDDLLMNVGSTDTGAVRLDSDNTRLWLRYSAIRGVNAPAEAVGITQDGAADVYVVGSIIEDLPVGVDVTGGADLIVENSTILSLDEDLVHDGPGFLQVTASTLTAGIRVTGANGPARVDNSTVTGALTVDGALRQLQTRSSIVLICNNGVVDDGFNVGGCFGTADALLLPLADNDCAFPTPTGCQPTRAIPPDSPAVGAGDCTEGQVGGVPPDDIVELFLGQDQRMFGRSPAGPGCDAGAYEIGPGSGDVNCDDTVSILDILMIAQYTVGLRTGAASCPLDDPLTELRLPGADVNGDGAVSVIDALLLAQCNVGLTNEFCGE